MTYVDSSIEKKAALIKGAMDPRADELNKPPGLTFAIIQEVEMQDRAVNVLPAAEHRRPAAARSTG